VHVTSERGYAMAALLVAMSVIAIVLSTALPVFSTMAKRERETELIFRGQQYARAVTLFQRKYGNALPPNLDVLLNERFLRKQFKDPITNEDFQLIGPGSPELALAETAAPVQAGRGGGQQQRGGGPPISQQQPFQQPQMSGRGVQSNPVTAGQAPGGVLGVVSKSKATSLRIYNNHDKYNEWVFIATLILARRRARDADDAVNLMDAADSVSRSRGAARAQVRGVTQVGLDPAWVRRVVQAAVASDRAC
jgi:type II secretory pathway pseudopilin PulG